MGWKLLCIILVGVFLINFVYAVSDTAVFQGQYYKGTEFQQGTYEFKFDIYTGEIFGDLVYSDTQNLTTGIWGQWRIELDGISAACNDTAKDYFMEITIDNSIQIPRRRLTHFTYLRKNVNEITIGNLTIGSMLNFILGGYLYELNNLFVLNKNLQIQGDLNVTGNATIAGEVNIIGETKIQGQLVCLENGTNCQTASVADTNCSVEGSCGLITYDSELNYYNDSDIDGNETVFIDWDKNSADDFSGAWGDLSGVPFGFSDNVDNNTIYTSGDGNISIIGTIITFIGNLFSGSWNDLTDVPAGFSDGIDDVGENYTHLSNFTDDILWTTSFNNTGDSRWLDDTTIGNCSVEGSCGLITYDSELNYTVDTNAQTICSSDEVLLGNGSCISSSGFGGGNGGVQYVSFISTIDGDLKKTTIYLPLGTDSVAAGDAEASWIIDRNMTITGILWNALSNARTSTSEVILMKSTSNKAGFFDTSLSVDIQASTKGSQTGFNVTFSQGDLAVIKYTSTTGGTEIIRDLSITLIGTYD